MATTRFERGRRKAFVGDTDVAHTQKGGLFFLENADIHKSQKKKDLST